MALDPERELKGVWSYWIQDAKAAYSRSDHNGFFSDERNRDDSADRRGRNSIMDAEALLCFLQPQGTIHSFSVRNGFHSTGIGVDVINSIVRPSHKETGAKLDEDGLEIILELAVDFLETNRTDNAPDFSGRTYLDSIPDTPEELRDGSVDLVDSFSMSVSACLQLLHLCGLNGWGNEKNTNAKIVERCKHVRDLANSRLTAALTGLCQSFAYTEASVTKWQEATMIRWPERDEALATIQKRLAALSFRVNESQAFECGWSWGIHDQETPLPVGLNRAVGHPGGIALANPYLYFTINTIDGIDDLFEPWVQTEEVLDPIQLSLTARLRNLTDLTSRYWAALAFGDSLSSTGRWALESVPWRTADGSASLQWSLYVYGLALREHINQRRATTSYELERLIDLLEELAQAGRLTRPPIDHPIPPAIQSRLQAVQSKLEDSDRLSDSDLKQMRRDPALSLHSPGVPLNLEDSTGRSVFEYRIYDYAPQLVKRAALLLANTSELQYRERLRRLIDYVWDDHLGLRSNSRGIGPKFWDFPNKAYASFQDHEHTVISYEDELQQNHRDGRRVSSWYITQRVVEAIVALDHDSDRSQQSRLPTIEPFVRELSHHLMNDIDRMLFASGPSDRPRLEDLRTKVMSINEDHRRGDLTTTLRNLFELIRKL